MSVFSAILLCLFGWQLTSSAVFAHNLAWGALPSNLDPVYPFQLLPTSSTSDDGYKCAKDEGLTPLVRVFVVLVPSSAAKIAPRTVIARANAIPAGGKNGLKRPLVR
ncbi:chitinase [Aspergillus luchuensis]|uniref:Chitinase n=1 Tax=Aspergillus kawachii TaxID=1069201 RepID=A0A146FZL2_ASPKA|nr:chitinase [Aspergillus luchuensis]